MHRIMKLLALALFTACAAGDVTELVGEFETPLFEDPSWFTAQDEQNGTEEHPPTTTFFGVHEEGSDYGQTEQAFTSGIGYGWRLSSNATPTFFDWNASPNLVGMCGKSGFHDRNCAFIHRPNTSSQVRQITWRWERGFAGSGFPSCGQMNNNDLLLDGMRTGAQKLSENTGWQFIEVNGVSEVENITLFCDTAIAAASTAHAYAFGPATGPLAPFTNGPEPGQCGGTWKYGKPYTYRSGGIAINPNSIQGWRQCPPLPGQPFLTTAQHRKIGEVLFMHEMMHLLGFVHQTGIPWMTNAPTCETMTGGSSPTIPTWAKNMMKGLRTVSENAAPQLVQDTRAWLTTNSPQDGSCSGFIN